MTIEIISYRSILRLVLITIGEAVKGPTKLALVAARARISSDILRAYI